MQGRRARRDRSHTRRRIDPIAGRYSPRRHALALAVGAAFAVSGSPAYANPTGGAVAAGSASFAVSGSTLTITNAPGTIINWQQFSIQKDEITRFLQQNASSAVLNRVIAQNPSIILGQLLSNGRVFLINPSGIAFGQGAIIDVAGFAASTLNISDADFISGRMRFVGSGAEGKLENAGTIRTPEGGHIYLIAPNVENQASGVINSPNGEVVIAAGQMVELVNARTPDIRVELTAPENQAVNAGQIVAASGSIGIYGTLIKNSGLVSASRAEIGDGGRIVFKAVKDVTLDTASKLEANGAGGGKIELQADTGTLLAQGKIEAKGEEGKGGEIQLLAKQVAVNDAEVDASGKSGGGVVLAGGDFQGSNPAIQNAQRTVVTPSATIRADATGKGDGGKVIVWADGDTRYYGNITARGGPEGGDGGFVEVSGKEVLAFRGQVDTSAPLGKTGELLLDPGNITIEPGAITNANFTANAADGLWDLTEDVGSETIGAANVSALLDTTDLTLQATNNVTFNTNADVVYSNSRVGAFFTVEANNSITMKSGANVRATGAGALIITLTANNGTGGGDGLADIQSGALLQSKGGDITVEGAAVTITGATLNASTGTVKLIASAGAVTQSGSGSLTAIGLLVVAQNTSVLNSATNNVVVLAANITGASQDFKFVNNDVLEIGTVSGNAGIVTSGGNVSLAADAITLNASVGNVGNTFTLLNADNGDVTSGGTGNVVLGGDVLITASGNVGTTGAVVETSAANLAVNATAGNVYVSEANGVSLRDLTRDTVTVTNNAGGDLFIASNGTLTLAADVDAAGSITLNAASGGANQTAGAVTASELRILGNGNFALDSATNNVATLAANVGTGSLSYRDGDDLAVGSITSFDGTGTTATSGLTVGGNASLTTLNGGNLTVGQAINTSNNGSVTLTNDGQLNLNAQINADGDVIQNGAGVTVLNADIVTTVDLVKFDQKVILSGDRLIDTTNAPASGSGGKVWFANATDALDGAGNALTIGAASTGDIVFDGPSSGLSSLLVNSGKDFVVNGSLSANGSIDVTVSGAINVNAPISNGGTAAATTLSANAMNLASTVNGGTGAVTITTTAPGTAINLGGEAGGLSLTDAEIDNITAAGSINIGTLSHNGTINVVGNASVAPANLTALNIVNGGTAGADSVTIGATLSAPMPITVETAAGHIKFTSAGKILANGAATADRVVNLTATSGRIDGNATNVADYIAGAPFSNVQADRLNATAQAGIGVPNALITEVADIQASTANTDINIYNVGALNVAGTGINSGIDAAGGNLTLVATGAITQAAPVLTDALSVITLNSPGANITLTNASNDAQSYQLFACRALPGGCPSDNPVLSTSGTDFGNGTNANYAAGVIQYRDSNGANLSGIGTISAFSTFTAGDTTVSANSISASTITLEASGNITINLGANLTKINNAGTGSFNLIAGGDIIMLNTSGTIGTSASAFKHDLTFRAAGNLTFEKSIFQGTGKNLVLAADDNLATVNQTVAPDGVGDVTLLGNYILRTGGDVNVTGVDFSMLGGSTGGAGQSPYGQELTADGTINLLNSGVITVQAGTATSTSASGSRMTAGTINIGANGAPDNPTRLLIQGGTNNNRGHVTSITTDPLIELLQPDAIVESTGDMFVYLRSDSGSLDDFGAPYSLEIRGGTATANDSGGALRFVTALGALRADNMTVMADGSVLIKGGTTNLNAASTFAATSAIVLVEFDKLLTTGSQGSVIIKGGTANVSPLLTSVSARNALALGQLDPSKLILNVAGSLVLQGGTYTGPFGSLVSARIDAGDEIKINVFGPITTYNYTNTALGPRSRAGSFFMIGPDDSGFYDSNNTALGGTSFPTAYPITVFAPGGFAKEVDAGRGAAVVQTGLSTFDESLLSYIIFAANEETRAARIRRGLGEGDDLGAPTCK